MKQRGHLPKENNTVFGPYAISKAQDMAHVDKTPQGIFWKTGTCAKEHVFRQRGMGVERFCVSFMAPSQSLCVRVF